MTFVDIRGLERNRTYYFKDGTYTIEDPVLINVTKKPGGDSHRLVDAKGVNHYIPSGWFAISFEGEWKF